MRKTAIVFLLMSFVFVSAVDIKNIRNKTNSQLMGNVVDGTTEADANYLEDWIGNNLKAIIDFTNESRHRSAYQTLSDALTDSTGTTEAGIVLGKPNYTDTLRDTTAYLTGKMALSFPNSYKIDWRETKYWGGAGEQGDVLFYSSNDTNITIQGGELYGGSDVNYVDGAVAGLSSNYDDIYFDGVTVAADSLVKWYIHILSGTGSGQTRRITGNTATAGGSTLATVGENWVTRPNSTSTYRLTPMEEYQSAIDINKGKQIVIKDIYIHDFAGDGIAITGCELVWIDNCVIDIPLRWYYQSGSGNSQNLVGRQGITLSGGSSGTWYDRPGTTKLTGLDTLRYVRISNSKIRGGYPGGIDLEPLGRCYIETLEISDCEIQNTEGNGGSALIFVVSDSSVVKNLIIRHNLIKSDGTGIWIQDTGTSSRTGYWENIEIIDNTIIPLTVGTGNNGIFIMGNKYHKLKIQNNLIANWKDRGLEITASVTDAEVSGNRFYNNGDGAGLPNNFYNSNSYRVKLENNIFKDNGVTDDSSGTQMYLSDVNEFVAKGNVFICTASGTIDRGLKLYSCDSVIVHYNISYGHANDEVSYDAVTNARVEYNTAGFSDSDADSLSANVTYDYGNSDPGDTTAALHIENKRITMNFKGYRDSYGAVTGAKIVMKSTGEWSADDPWRVQKGHLEFYTLDMLPLGLDRSRIRALITGKGMGMPDSSYICFFPANSATVVENTGDADSLWKYVNSYGYGLRELGGKVQYKHSGGSWADIGGGAGSGDVTGPASSVDNAIVRFDGITGKAIQSNQYVKMLDDGTTGWGLGAADPAVWITVNPTLETGILVTDEAVPAMVDSCAGIGVASGAGFIKLYAGDGSNSTITVGNSDYMWIKDASTLFVQKKQSGCITVSSENTYTGLDSMVSIYTYLGNGAILMMAASGPKAGIIYQSASDGMRFINADKYKFSANIEADAGIVFNQKTADPSAGTGMFIRNVTSADADTLITRDASGNLKRWISEGGSSISVEGETELADDAYIQLPSSVNGWCEAMTSLNGEFIRFRFSNNGVVTLLSDCSANTASTNTDDTFCAYDGGDHVKLKNRLGTSKYVKYVYHYSSN